MKLLNSTRSVSFCVKGVGCRVTFLGARLDRLVQIECTSAYVVLRHPQFKYNRNMTKLIVKINAVCNLTRLSLEYGESWERGRGYFGETLVM